MTSLRRCRWTKTGDRSSQIERTTGEMGLGRSIWTILWLTTINLPHRRKSPGYVRNLARTAALIREAKGVKSARYRIIDRGAPIAVHSKGVIAVRAWYTNAVHTAMDSKGFTVAVNPLICLSIFLFRVVCISFKEDLKKIMEIAHFIFGVFGNATALFLFLAPVITFKRIIRSKSTEQFSGIPYVMTLLNNLLSAWYGLPFVSENNILVSTINGTGAVIESIYVLIFLIYATKKEKAKIFGLLIFVLSVFAAVALVSLLAMHGNTRKIFCGFAAAIFSIIMYASPLSIVRMVIKTKSVEFMPFFLSLFVFLCGTSWFIYGLLGRDPFVAVPNGFGSGLGTVQLILYFIYRNKGGLKKPDPASNGSSKHIVPFGFVNHKVNTAVVVVRLVEANRRSSTANLSSVFSQNAYRSEP
ncbi:hypothetical protein LWI28_011724 [Acer negundo]|uniref:Bidirectional sugar transporter SWEET n=1 Tax=Acer negundo TaxID=4023 RepID=A0AAD5JSJ8_ACENE|nr:hypothetical protein LWI28_011724 [Acer negundo]